LKSKYKKEEFERDVASAHHDLFTQQGDEFVFVGVEGFVPDSEVSGLRTALSNEKTFVKGVKTELDKWKALGKFEDVQKTLDRAPELEALAEGMKDKASIDKLVETRANGLLVPVQRKLDEALGKIKEHETTIAGYVTAGKRTTLYGETDKAAVKLQVRPEHYEDVRLYAERYFEVGDDGKPVTKSGIEGTVPGLSPEVWLGGFLAGRPGWRLGSSGSGSGGSGENTGSNLGNNPFVTGKENYTQQSAMIENDPNMARQMIRQAGGDPKAYNL